MDSVTANEISAIHNSERVQLLLRNVDMAQLARSLGQASNISQSDKAANPLRVAATLALAEVLANKTIDRLFEQFNAPTKSPQETDPNLASVFRKWMGYLEALLEDKQTPTLDDLLLFSVAGFLARKPSEVRHFLRRPPIRLALDNALALSYTLPWAERVRNHISIALLFLVRQENHRDVSKAGTVMQSLATDQKEIEADWLESQSNPRRDAFTLLGYYHLAQAVERLAEFLLAGSITHKNEPIFDFEPTLRGLLSRAEEYLLTSNMLDIRLWLNGSLVLLWQLYQDSIWVAGRGISKRVDALLETLATTGRQNPIFSLLPSQQEALRQNLLDPARIAVVLQMPTSAGKTLLAEFAIVQAFEAYKQARVVYLTPTRALATQIRRTLTEDLHPLNIQVSAAGSAFEEDPYEFEMLSSTDGIVVATPEKLDLLLRAHPNWFNSLRLLVVDEAHLLRESERGVRLELLLANIRREQPQTRILLLTPFVENAQEIATWLGEEQGLPISVNWRPSRILLGLAKIGGRGHNRALNVSWSDPYFPGQEPSPLHLPTQVPAKEVQSLLNRIVYLAEQFKDVGTLLAMFTSWRVGAEQAAQKVASKRHPTPLEAQPPALKLAIALARDEYGPNSTLAHCLGQGVSFHHSMLSPILRYLIEDQVRARTIGFIAATTTLAQGLNFPVATVLVHSVAKPYGKGNLSPGEFWNIAGRAGRVGMVDKGLVLFADAKHAAIKESYTKHLNEALQSALLEILKHLPPNIPLETLYDVYPETRPFLQYLGHIAATSTPAQTLDKLDTFLDHSLASTQIQNSADRQRLYDIAAQYLEEIASRNPGYLKIADSTGLASFSFDKLCAKVSEDPLLLAGPGEILRQKETGLVHLLEALQDLPELNLSGSIGSGKVSLETLAQIIQGWIEGKPIYEIAILLSGPNEEAKIRDVATYLYGTVSQTISWGTHAYMRSWAMQTSTEKAQLPPHEAMLAAYIEYGVNSPEAAVAALLNIPRQFTEAFASVYREVHGSLLPQHTLKFRQFVEEADLERWTEVVARSSMADMVEARDIQAVWRQMQGIS